MTTTFFFLMPMIYLSGFIFPIENMPPVIQWVTYLIPLRYFLGHRARHLPQGRRASTCSGRSSRRSAPGAFGADAGALRSRKRGLAFRSGLMRVHIGTSGYNYPEWRGTFYPEKLTASKMFGYYAERFPTVEINYTFYRMPTPKTTAAWLAQAPAGFTYALKAPRQITHIKRLKDCGDCR